MNENVDVFDEWGRFIGRFRITVWAGDFWIVALAVLIMAVLASLVYMFFWLLVKGVQVFFSDQPLKSLKYFVIPFFLMGFFAYQLYSGAGGISGIRESRAYGADLKDSVTFTFDSYTCPDQYYCELNFTIRNGYPEEVFVEWDQNSTWWKFSPGYLSIVLSPGESENFTATIRPEELELTKRLNCLTVSSKYNVVGDTFKFSKARICPATDTK